MTPGEIWYKVCRLATNDPCFADFPETLLSLLQQLILMMHTTAMILPWSHWEVYLLTYLRRRGAVFFVKDCPSHPCRWCGARLGGPKSNANIPTLGLFCGTHLRMTSYKTTHKAQRTSQTPSPWWWSRSPLQRHGFDDAMLLEGWAALHTFFPRLALQGFNWFTKLMLILTILY